MNLKNTLNKTSNSVKKGSIFTKIGTEAFGRIFARSFVLLALSAGILTIGSVYGFNDWGIAAIVFGSLALLASLLNLRSEYKDAKLTLVRAAEIQTETAGKKARKAAKAKAKAERKQINYNAAKARINAKNNSPA